MTVTLVFGKTGDGYIHSFASNYTDAKNGPADTIGVNAANGYVGRNGNGSSFSVHECFCGFDWPAIPSTEMVTAVSVRIFPIVLMSPSYAQQLEVRGYTWSTGGGLVLGDFRNPTQLAGYRLDGATNLTSAAKLNRVQLSSDEMLSVIAPYTSLESIIVTNHNRSGTAPTRDEAIAVSLSSEAGTVYDPLLRYTSVTRSTLFGVMGAQVQIDTGWVWLESNGAVTPTITLKYRPTGSVTVTTIATVPIGTTATTFRAPGGLQAFALVADPAGNLFVLSRSGSSENSLAVIGYARGGGTTWTAKTVRTISMPNYGGAINQVAAAWQDYAFTGGTGSIIAFAGHVSSVGDSVTHNETSHVVINTVPILANTGITTLALGYTLPSLGATSPPSGYFNGWHNEVGTGMDVVTGPSGTGYFYSFGKNQNPGDTEVLFEGWYQLNAGSTGFTSTRTHLLSAYGRKDAAGKVRAVPISPQGVAFISADADPGFGITVDIRNHSGTNSTQLGFFILSGEGIPSMPDGPALGATPAWDAVYNAVENKLWIYYPDASDVGKVRRTGIDLSTMQATLSEVTVYDDAGAGIVRGVRVQRNASVGQTSLVTIAVDTAGALTTQYVVDTFNIAPTEPTLIPESNYDATTAQTFQWIHNDPNGDAQSAYQLEISNASTGVVVLDTGKVVSATPSRSVAGSTLTNGVDYRWRVKTWDTSDVVGPYSTYGTFSTSAGGTVTITSPATNDPVGVITDDIPVTWSATGTTQSAYRIWLYRGSTLVSDTNWVASTATGATVSGMLSDQGHEIHVQIRNAALVVTNVAIRTLTPSFSTPEKPIPTIVPNGDEGFVLITVDNPAPGAPVLGYPEEGFESGVGTWTPSTGSTFTQDLAVYHLGAASGKITVTVAGQSIYFARDPANRVAVVPGERYTARLWIRRSVAGTAGVGIDWYTAGNVYISTSSFEQALSANVWTYVEVTGTAPSTAAFAGYGPTLTGSPAVGVSLNADEVVLTSASDRPNVYSNDILRRIAGTTDPFEVVGAAFPDGSFRDYTATAGRVYEYRIRGQA